MKRYAIIAALLLAMPLSLFADDYIDDIYFNPKKDKIEKKEKKEKKSYYVENMADVDVDAYNRHGETYYLSPIDTIGAGMETAEDYVNVQKLQKFYNPTIILDNADLLEDVLNNSVGNVEINYYGGIPYFSYNPYYSWYPSYYSYCWNPAWNWGWNWGWGSVWYDPWYSWGWGPSWSWGPSWGWGPSWSWGPTWNYAGTYSPNGNQRVGASGWATNTSGSYQASHRPNNTWAGTGSNRVSSAKYTGNKSTGYSYNKHRGSATDTGSKKTYNTNNYNRYNNSNGHRYNTNVNKNKNTYNKSNNTNTHRSNSSYRQGTGSYGGGRSSGGSYGGGRSGGGGGGGRHR